MALSRSAWPRAQSSRSTCPQYSSGGFRRLAPRIVRTPSSCGQRAANTRLDLADRLSHPLSHTHAEHHPAGCVTRRHPHRSLDLMPPSTTTGHTGPARNGSWSSSGTRGPSAESVAVLGRHTDVVLHDLQPATGDDSEARVHGLRRHLQQQVRRAESATGLPDSGACRLADGLLQQRHQLLPICGSQAGYRVRIRPQGCPRRDSRPPENRWSRTAP